MCIKMRYNLYVRKLKFKPITIANSLVYTYTKIYTEIKKFKIGTILYKEYTNSNFSRRVTYC